MTPDFWYKYDGVTFSPFDETELLADEILDWYKWLAKAGFVKHSHFGAECEACEVEVFKGLESAPWLVTVMLGDSGAMNAICQNAPVMLKFIREHCLPLLDLNAQELQRVVYNRALDTIFDQNDGLQCVQRVAQREHREWLIQREQEHDIQRKLGTAERQQAHH